MSRNRGLNYRLHDMRKRMCERGTTSIRGGAAESAKHFAAAMSSVPIDDPVFDETMRRAAEHKKRRNHIKGMAAKLKAMREART